MPGFTITYTPRQREQHRLLLEKFGSWDAVVKASEEITRRRRQSASIS